MASYGRIVSDLCYTNTRTPGCDKIIVRKTKVGRYIFLDLFRFFFFFFYELRLTGNTHK